MEENKKRTFTAYPIISIEANLYLQTTNVLYSLNEKGKRNDASTEAYVI
jgi:hypothetical protein